MTDASLADAALDDCKARPPDITTATPSDNAAFVVPVWLRLPAEIWEHIAYFLSALGQSEQVAYPRPDCKSLDASFEYKASNQKNLVALALTCKRLTAVAVKALYRAPFLSTADKVNQLVETLCQNNRGVLVPEKCESVRWIRALHVHSLLTDDYHPSLPKRFCTCDSHVLFSLADQVRYVSLDWMDARQVDFYEDYQADHLLNHFLSATTKCRPRGLRWKSKCCVELSLARATSYAPLSQLTHLELIGSPAPEGLVSFLLGAAHLAGQDPKLKEAISAGLSPSSKLECLRVSEANAIALTAFGEGFAMWADTEWAEDRFDGPIDLQHAQTMFELATNAGNLPNLRLLVLDASHHGFSFSGDLLKRLARRGLLKHDPGASPGTSPGTSPGASPSTPARKSHAFATSSLSSLFDRGMRDISDELRNADLRDGQPEWQAPAVESADRYWKLIHRGKHALLELWNGARKKKGLGPTEIRVVARSEPSDRFAIDFAYQAASFDLPNCQTTSRRDPSAQASTDMAGIWADPDVFSLVKAMPWLSYRHVPEYGCCYWSGELPRDNNPNAIPAELGGEVEHVTVPVLVKLPVSPKEQEGMPKRQNTIPHDGEDNDTEEARRKRQRTDSTSTPAAGPSRT